MFCSSSILGTALWQNQGNKMGFGYVSLACSHFCIFTFCYCDVRLVQFKFARLFHVTFYCSDSLSFGKSAKYISIMERPRKTYHGSKAIAKTNKFNEERDIEEQLPIRYSQTNKKASRNQGKRTSKVKKTLPFEKYDGGNTSHVSLPQIVLHDEDTDEKGQEKVAQNESNLGLNRFSHLPPIPSDTNSIRTGVLVNTKNSVVSRNRLPPIKKQPTDEKPESNRRKMELSAIRKKEKDVTNDIVQSREIKNRERMERHARKRKEKLDAWETEQSLKMEKHLSKLDQAERNKEELRQQRKRKLECEEEKRRRAKERVISHYKFIVLYFLVITYTIN